MIHSHDSAQKMHLHLYIAEKQTDRYLL